ncbi:MAG: hypothetical protein AW06_002052 [Candidatus Accumulibacter cognatus]|uniref:Uncharacterized protein n=1 Tax=Candidatus Accumulibacter cognatus TaxID=2954383 RepID=A0A080M772_9PROT|nr:MAG: hypothetical protein AW06_002052 [Candidatus Accumulibacter cognatus]
MKSVGKLTDSVHSQMLDVPLCQALALSAGKARTAG